MKSSFQSLQIFDEALRESEGDLHLEIFKNPSLGTVASRFSIYANAYDAHTQQSLEGTFPVLKSQMPLELWLDLGYRYTRQWPTESYRLFDVANGLPDFLKQDHWDQRYCDLADFELAVSQSFDAADANLEIDNVKFSQISELSIFLFQPNVHFFQSQFQISKFWKQAVSGFSSEHLVIGAECGILTRQKNEVFIHLISKEEFQILNSLRSGLALGTALENKIVNEVSVEDLSAWLAKWFGWNLFSNCLANLPES